MQFLKIELLFTVVGYYAFRGHGNPSILLLLPVLEGMFKMLVDLQQLYIRSTAFNTKLICSLKQCSCLYYIIVQQYQSIIQLALANYYTRISGCFQFDFEERASFPGLL